MPNAGTLRDRRYCAYLRDNGWIHPMKIRTERDRFSTMKLACSGAMACAMLALTMGAPQAAGGHGGGADHGMPAGLTGQAADAADADRTVEIDLVDNAYRPATVAVEAGETVRFLVTNKGELVHEFSIGTPAMHQAHRKEMMQMMDDGVLEADRINHAKMKGSHGMSHADPNSVLLEPGRSGEVVWTFPQAGNVEIACNVPGHYEAGMKGVIDIR